MSSRQQADVVRTLFILAAAALSACTHAGGPLSQAASETTASAPAPETTASLPVVASPAPAAAPMTREKASTDCWMKYEGSGLSLDQRLPLVEKCTAEKLKTQAAR